MTACTLDAAGRDARLREFSELVARADERTFGSGAFRVRFRPDAALAARLAELTAREVECCSFFRFRLELDVEALTLVATAPSSEAQTLKRMFSTSPSSTT